MNVYSLKGGTHTGELSSISHQCRADIAAYRMHTTRLSLHPIGSVVGGDVCGILTGGSSSSRWTDCTWNCSSLASRSAGTLPEWAPTCWCPDSRTSGWSTCERAASRWRRSRRPSSSSWRPVCGGGQLVLVLSDFMEFKNRATNIFVTWISIGFYFNSF